MQLGISPTYPLDEMIEEYQGLDAIDAALDLDRRLNAGKGANNRLETSDLKVVLDQLNIQSLEHRADKLANYIGSVDVDKNAAIIKAAITALTKNPDGRKATAKQFQDRLNDLYGVVFTAHPTFSMNPELQAIFNDCTLAKAKGAEISNPLQHKFEKGAAQVYRTPTLDSEGGMITPAAENLDAAIRMVEQIAIEVTKRAYPEEWKSMRIAPITNATWHKFDWDGRADVTWNMAFAERIDLLVKRLQTVQGELWQIMPNIRESEANEELHDVMTRIGTTILKMEEYRTFFGGYHPETDPDFEELAKTNKAMLQDIDTRVAHIGDLIDPLTSVLEKTRSVKAQMQVKLVIERLKTHGLTMQQPHFRINSQSALSALMDEIDFDPNLTGKELDAAILAQLNDLIENVQVKSTNLSDGDNRRTAKTVVKQMAINSGIVNLVDRGARARFLIAETHAAAIPLAVLYYAKKMGVEKALDISPLFEDRDGIEEANRVLRELCSNEAYVDYVKKTGRFCIQLGYSDSGRYDGQPSAGAFLERVKGLATKILAEKGLAGDVELVFFDTHGESYGRGGHPLNVESRASYAFPAWLLNDAEKKGVNIKCEESCQGGDGYLRYGSFEFALADVAQTLTHLTASHPEVENDYHYDEEGRELAKGFFDRARKQQDKLSSDPRTATLIAAFKNFIPKTGSRPVKRDASSGGARALPRAIPHNGIMAQLGMHATVFYGLRKAIESDTQGFEDLLTNSKMFRQRMSLIKEAFEGSDGQTITSYIALYNPAFWQDYARIQNDPNEKEKAYAVAKMMGRLGFYDEFAPIVAQLSEEYEMLRPYLDNLEVPTTGSHNDTITKTAHGIRMAAMIDLFKRIVDIPEAARAEIGHEEIERGLVSLDMGFLSRLQESFASSANGTLPDFGIESELTPEDRGYAQLDTGVLNPINQDLDVIMAASHPIMHHNGFVG